MGFSINPLTFASIQLSAPVAPGQPVPPNTPAQNVFLQNLAILLTQMISQISTPAFTAGSTRIVLGALTIQWGNGTTGTATTFGKAFSASAYAVTLTATSAGADAVYLTGISNTGFSTSASAGTPTFNYIAIGPT